jgi:hypothetical protein
VFFRPEGKLSLMTFCGSLGEVRFSQKTTTRSHSKATGLNSTLLCPSPLRASSLEKGTRVTFPRWPKVTFQPDLFQRGCMCAHFQGRKVPALVRLRSGIWREYRAPICSWSERTGQRVPLLTRSQQRKLGIPGGVTISLSGRGDPERPPFGNPSPKHPGVWQTRESFKAGLTTGELREY